MKLPWRNIRSRKSITAVNGRRGIIALLAILSFTVNAHAEFVVQNLQNFHYGDTNAPAPATNLSAENSATNWNISIPIVQFSDVPLTKAIESLALQGEFNCLLDPAYFPAKDSNGKAVAEPLVTKFIKNATPREALATILSDNQLTLIEDPVSHIDIITGAGQVTNLLLRGETEAETNPFSIHTNLIPLVQFNQVPITTGIDSLARQENVNYAIDPEVDWSYQNPEPELSFRLEKVTAWNTLVRILNLYNLVLLEDPVSHVAIVTSASRSLPAMNFSLFDVDTNNPLAGTNVVEKLIAFTNAPLDAVLENIIQKSSRNITLDSRITGTINPRSGWLEQMPRVSISWNITPQKALIALCRTYHLTIIQSPATGIIKIEPEPRKRK